VKTHASKKAHNRKAI